ncbi:MAG: calcium-binding protein, partial [Sphingobium sp.]
LYFSGTSVVSGGAGNDIITSTVTGTNPYYYSSISYEDKIDGGEGDDTITSTMTFTDLLEDTTITAKALLTGGAGKDHLTVVGGDQNVLDGGIGDDVLAGGSGHDRLIGGDGIDTALYSGARTDYQVDKLSDGTFQVTDLRAGSPDSTDILDGVEKIQFADTLVSLVPDTPKPVLPQAYVGGGNGNDDIRATNDPDGTILNAGGGNDILRGGRFDDVLTGGAGDDVLYGGGGADQFRFFGNQIEGTSDTDRIYDLNFAQGDRLVFGSFGASTFENDPGINAFSSGTAAIITSFGGLANAVDSGAMTASRQGNSDNLVLQLENGAGQIQKIVVSNGWANYVSAAAVIA